MKTWNSSNGNSHAVSCFTENIPGEGLGVQGEGDVKMWGGGGFSKGGVIVTMAGVWGGILVGRGQGS